MKSINFLFLSGLTLSTILQSVHAQPNRYALTAGPNNTQLIKKESRPSSNVFDQLVSTLPSDAAQGRLAGRSLLPYAPEPRSQINMTQFGTGKYYSPKFHFCIDVLGNYSVDERRAVGINTFSQWSVKEEHKSQLKPGEGFLYTTENFLGPLHSNVLFHLLDLQTFLNYAWNQVPVLGYGQFENYGIWAMDIESSIYLDAGPVDGPPLPGWPGKGYFGGTNPTWDSWKDKVIQMESSPEKITVEKLALRGYDSWQAEMHVRRSNRLALLAEICLKKSKPGTKVSMGCAMWIGFPVLNGQGGNSIFLDGHCMVRHIGGDANGNITMSIPSGEKWTVRLHGDQYDHEQVMDNYWYQGAPEIDPNDFNDIFTQHKEGTQNYQYLWSKIKPIHVVGEDKASIQFNRGRMIARQGKTRPMIRQMERRYEFYGPRLPFKEVQNVIRYNNPAFRDTPPLYQPPYEFYSRYAVTRFFAGDEADWGLYLFPEDPGDIIADLTTYKDPEGRNYYGVSQHTVSALLQARADMQPYETYYPGSTLVENPEVQVNQTGTFAAYTGAEALNNTGGVQGPIRPAYLLRYKPVTGGWRVLVLGGTKQNWTEERTDIVRVSGGGLNGNRFKIKLRGPSAQLYEFFVKSSDSNQTYEAQPTAQPAWEKPGYAGRVGAIPTN